MWRGVGGVVLGYLVMSLFVFATFSVAYVVMGADRAFEFDTYDVTGLWSVTSIVLNLLAAIVGGLACVAVARSVKPGYVLAGIVLVLGLVMALPSILAGAAPVGPRPADVSLMDAMMKAKQPAWLSLLTPIEGALGVVLGARTRTRRGVV